MIEMVMGRVSKAFLPYSSDRFPINGVIIIAPNPMICITLGVDFIFKICPKNKFSNNDIYGSKLN
jgi:hypothetical protein